MSHASSAWNRTWHHLILQRYRIGCFTLALAAPLTFSSHSVAALGETTITISPTTQQLAGSPGENITSHVDLVNNGTHGNTIHLSASPYSVQQSSYMPVLHASPGTPNTATWITFDAQPNSIRGHHLLTIPFTVRIPAHAAAGGYYAAVLASALPSDSQNQRIAFANRVGSILYITVKGALHPDGRASFNAIPSFVVGDAIPIETSVSNTGNVHFTSHVAITSTQLGESSHPTIQSDYIVLPHTTRRITSAWRVADDIGVYQVQTSASLPASTAHGASAWVVVVRPVLLRRIGIALLICAIVVNCWWIIRRIYRHDRT